MGGRHNLVSFTPIYMDTLGQWKSFPFEDRKGGEKARLPELNCDGTQCVKVCAFTHRFHKRRHFWTLSFRSVRNMAI